MTHPSSTPIMTAPRMTWRFPFLKGWEGSGDSKEGREKQAGEAGGGKEPEKMPEGKSTERGSE